MFIQTFEVRWSDLDANRHVANTAYSNFMIATRMGFFRDSGFLQEDFERHRIGPAIISEEFHYLRETPPDGLLRVDVELAGLSADERFIQFHHSVYHPDGSLAVFARCTFCWIHLDTRKVREAPPGLAAILRKLERAQDFRELSKADAFPVGLPRRRRLDSL